MAGREPPPFDDDGKKEEEELFADAENEEKLPESHPIGDPEPEPEPPAKTKIPVDIKPDSDEEDDNDLFSGGGDEVTLDSDNEEPFLEPAPVSAPAPTNTQPQSSPAALEPEPIRPISAAEERPRLVVSQSSTATSKGSGMAQKSTDDGIEEDPYTIDIKIVEPHKVGDGMGAYIVYKVITKTNIPVFRKQELYVIRRFSDFLGLHDKLSEKHVKYGRIVPPAPEKSVMGMAKVKVSKEESGSADFLERRRAALERFLNRTAAHPLLRVDPDFREFLDRDGELPKATSTSALSGAGVKRLLSKMGDAVDKMTFKMEESDEWFEEKHQQIDNLDQQLRKLHTGMENLTLHRRDLSVCTGQFAKSAAMLGNAEEHTALSRALSQLAETEEKIEQIHKEQADQDFYVLAELLKDYIALLGAVKDVLHERVKTYKTWKEAEAMLTKKREIKAKFEIAGKQEKVSQAQQEITEWIQRVEKGQRDFESISETIRKEVARFDRLRVEDFKTSVIKYLQHLMENQQQIIKHWETFLPEAKAIA